MNTTNFDNAFDRFCDDGYRPTGDREKQRIEFRIGIIHHMVNIMFQIHFQYRATASTSRKENRK